MFRKECVYERVDKMNVIECKQKSDEVPFDPYG